MPRRPLHAVQISFFSDPHQRPAVQLLQAWPTLVDVAEAADQAGIRVSVVQASAHSERLVRNGVHYYFLPFGRIAQPQRPRVDAALGELLSALCPDVFHVQGLDFPQHVLSLAALAPGVPIVLQDHADRAPRIWRRALWRRGMNAAAGIAFCSLDQAQPFVRAGLLRPSTRLYEIPESTSSFTPGDKADARRAAQVGGEPMVLWVGHLNENKDPLTVLDGVSQAARILPNLQMWCCFGTAPLMGRIRSRIRSDLRLRDRVHLLGPVPHERVEELMRAADMLVLGSHREGSGYALIEALACGLPPVVTDIPSFRSLTGDGAVGRLWPCGNPRALCNAVQSIAGRSGPAMRAAVRAHFERELSFDSLGRKLATLYQEVSVRSLMPGSTAVRMS